MNNYSIKAGTTDVSVVIRIIDSTDGTPETGVVYNTSGIALEYRRELAASTAITEATLAALTTAHADGGFLHIGNGYYRLDLPDAAVASGATGVLVHGTVTGMVVIGCYIQLVAYDPFDTVRLGLTALPNAAAEASGGLYTRGTGAGQINQAANGMVDANVVRNAGTAITASAGRQEVNTTHVGGTSQTARDIGASVLLSSGTGTGQVTLTSGRVNADMTHIATAAVSTSTAQLGVNVVNFGGSAGTFSSGRPEVNTSHAAGTAWNSGAIGASTLASDTITAAKIAADAITDAKVASDVTIASVTGAVGSVTGAVGSVTGAVGSVTGNVGGNVTGSVGSVATGGIVEASFATTAGSFAPLGIVDQGTAQSATSTTLVLRSAAAFADDELIGNIVVITGGSAGVGQARAITDYVGSTDTATVDTWATTPTGTITYKILADKTAASGSGLDAAGVRAAIGMASANLDTQLADLPTNAELATSQAAADDATLAAIAALTIPSAATIADAVWDEAISGHATSGSTGEALSAAGAAGDPWITALPGSYSAGQAGYIIGTNVNATISSRASQTSVDDVPTNAELATALGTADDAVLSAISGLNNLSQANIRTAVGLASANLDTQLDALPTAAENTTAVWAAAARTLTALDEDSTTLDLDATIRAAVGLASANLDTQLGDLPTAAENTSAVWAAGARTLTALDEDSTTLDLDATIRAAVGLASANLDTQLGDLPTNAELATSQAAADDATLSAIAALTIPSAASIADAVWDEAAAGHVAAGSTGEALGAAGAAGDPWITTLPGAYTAGQAGHTIGSLTFTEAGKVDANIKAVNDVEVTGTGETGDEWGP